MRFSDLTIRPASNHADSFQQKFLVSAKVVVETSPPCKRLKTSIDEEKEEEDDEIEWVETSPPCKRLKTSTDEEKEEEDDDEIEWVETSPLCKRLKTSTDEEKEEEDDDEIEWVDLPPMSDSNSNSNEDPFSSTSSENVVALPEDVSQDFSGSCSDLRQASALDHPLDNVSSARKMVYMIYDKMCSLESQQAAQTEMIKKKLATISEQQQQMFELPPFSDPLHATMAKIIYNYAFNSADGILLGVIYQDMDRNIKDRICIAINKNLLLDFMFQCFPQTKIYSQRCKRMDIFLHQLTMTTDWVPSLTSLDIIKKYSPAVLKKNDSAEQRQWFQFSLNSFLALDERACLTYSDNPNYVLPPNGFIFDEKVWSYTVCFGKPMERSYYEYSGIHSILEHLQQRKIMNLFLHYQGIDESILTQKRSLMASIHTHRGAYSYWSGDSMTLHFMDIWVKAQIATNNDANNVLLMEAKETLRLGNLSQENMIQIWNFLFQGKLPHKVNRTKAIRHHWVQTDDTIPKNTKIFKYDESPASVGGIPKKRGRKKKKKISIDQLENFIHVH